MPQTIYIADDEENIRALMKAFLSREGYEVEVFSDGDALLRAFEAKKADLVVLDIMMPGTDGLSVCSALRATSPNLPIIIVSAKDSPLDRVAGLTLGSDDYMAKPFLPLELVARVKALLRRVSAQTEQNAQKAESQKEIKVGSLSIFPLVPRALVKGEEIHLTSAEFSFLSHLARNAGKAVSRKELLHEVWQIDWESDTRATDDLVKRLRKKLREKDENLKIETVWGFGFRLEVVAGEKANGE